MTYNYSCLETPKCKLYNKIVQLEGKEDDKQECKECGEPIKQLGQATSIVHKGTQESKLI